MDCVKHIGVLMGGYSAEREISLKSGRAVYKALSDAGAKVSMVDIDTQENEKIEELIQSSGIEIAFIALHGPFGEDGQVQSLLEGMGISYIGSGVAASQMCMDKAKTQHFLRTKNFPIADFVVLEKKDLEKSRDLLAHILTGPVVVKPASQGSSFGISIVREKNQIDFALTKAFQYDDCVLVERFVCGREMTVGVIDEKALPVIEVVSTNEFFDFEAKYQKGKTSYIVPAKIEDALRDQLQQLALQAHCMLGCKDISRMDFIVDEKGNPYFLEINTIPGFTETSLVPMAAQSVGISFTELCLLLVGKVHGKKEKNKSITVTY